MLQRIQTLYLLIAEVLTISIFFSKIASFLTPNGQELLLKYNGLFLMESKPEASLINTWPMIALLAAAAFIGFVTIFLYRRRLLQIRLCFFSMVLNFGLLVLFGYYIYSISVVDLSKFTFAIADIFPILSIVLYFMAYKNIAKDEALVMADSFRARRK
jgi:hypothetical protein